MLVIASYGRQFVVRIADGRLLAAVTRGKRVDVSVGDRAQIQQTSDAQAVIDRIQPRRNQLQRTNERRSQRLAANIDQVGMVIAGSPLFAEELLIRVLIAAETEGIEVALIANKCDLVEPFALIEARLDCYRALGYPVLAIAAKTQSQAARAVLTPWLAGKTTLLLGQSGMGKSTLINTLVPAAQLATQEISQALSAGKHTTTFSRLFELPAAADSLIIDSPGFQSFGLGHLSGSQLIHGMREFAPLLGRCRFNDCTHRDEPGCAIRSGVEAGKLDAERYRLFARVIGQASSRR